MTDYLTLTLTDPSNKAPNRTVTIGVRQFADEIRGANRPDFELWTEEPRVVITMGEINPLQRGVILACADGLLGPLAARLALREGLHLQSKPPAKMDPLGRRTQIYQVRDLTQMGYNYAAPDERTELHDYEICHLSDLPAIVEELKVWARTSPVKALNSYGQQGQETLWFVTPEDRDAVMQRTVKGPWIVK